MGQMNFKIINFRLDHLMAYKCKLFIFRIVTGSCNCFVRIIIVSYHVTVCKQIIIKKKYLLETI